MNTKTNQLLSSYKSIIAVLLCIPIYLAAVGVLPLAEGVDSGVVFPVLLAPVLALILSDNMDTFVLLKKAVEALASVNFADKKLNDAFDALNAGIQMVEQAVPDSKVSAALSIQTEDTAEIQMIPGASPKPKMEEDFG